MRLNRKSSFALFGFFLVCFVLESCGQHYRHIPRQHNNQNTFKSNGHFVESHKRILRADTLPTPYNNFVSGQLQHFILDDTAKFLNNSQQRGRVVVTNTPIAAQISDSNSVDSTSKNKIDKSLRNGSGGVFAVVAGMNAAFVVTPTYNFLFMGLLIGLGLLIIGYFFAKFVENVSGNRITPIQMKHKSDPRIDKLKKAFQISMIVSGSCFLIALLTATTGSFGLPFAFAVFGVTSLWVGLLLGLVYIVANS